MIKHKQYKKLGFVLLVAVTAYGLLWYFNSPSALPIAISDTKDTASHSPRNTLPSVAKDASGNNRSSHQNQPEAVAPVAQVVNENGINNQVVTTNGQQYPLRTYRTQALPNDPFASQTWTTLANVEPSWDTPAGSPTTLAIIDTGFALAHQEFSNRWYQNTGEVGATSSEAPSKLNCSDRSLAITKSCNLIDDNFDGIVDNESGVASDQNPSQLNCSDQSLPLNKNCNLLDDDANGLADDSRGWDFINYDRSVQAGQINPAGSGTTHASYVTGAAAATGNNALGIAGVDWYARILPLQAIDDDGYGNTLSVARAIDYAAAQNADVISLSLGSVEPDDLVRGAMQRAIAAGSVVVAAAGNDGCDCMLYPAAYPEALAVGALDTGGNPVSFSSYGAALDIMAPGTNFRVPTWTSGNQTSGYAAGIAGTSLATPVVSATLTRLLATRPGLTPLQLLAALGETTNRSGLATTTSRSNTLGFGKLDTFSALQRTINPTSEPLVYQLASVSQGEKLNPSAPAEPLSALKLHTCSSARPGSTPVYRLQKGSSDFFTISQSENAKAIAAGYISTFFAYGCLTQPHDIFTTIRTLNTPREFTNLLQKPQ